MALAGPPDLVASSHPSEDSEHLFRQSSTPRSPTQAAVRCLVPVQPWAAAPGPCTFLSEDRRGRDGLTVQSWSCRVEPVSMKDPDECREAAWGTRLVSGFLGFEQSRLGRGNSRKAAPSIHPPNPQIAELWRTALHLHPDIKITHQEHRLFPGWFPEKPLISSPGPQGPCSIFSPLPTLPQRSWEVALPAPPPWLPSPIFQTWRTKVFLLKDVSMWSTLVITRGEVGGRMGDTGEECTYRDEH